MGTHMIFPSRRSPGCAADGQLGGWRCGDWKRIAHGLIVLVAVLGLLGGVSGFGAEDDAATGMPQVEAAGISASMASGVHFPRPNAPLPVSITLHCEGAQTRTGTLQVTICEGEQPLMTWRSPDWTISSTGRTQDVLLPPLEFSENHQELNAQLRWVEQGVVSDFPILHLTSGGSLNRPLVLAFCSGPGVDRKAALAATSLSSVLSSTSNAQWHADAHVMTETVATERLPNEPLALCAFEVVVLAGDAIDALTEHQLTALLTWVRAGGSLAILHDASASAALDAFLQRAGAQASHGEDGDALAPQLERIGLGRIALESLRGLDAPPPANAALAPFLWKIKDQWLSGLQQGEPLDPAALSKNAVIRSYGYPYNSNHTKAVGDSDDFPTFVAQNDNSIPQALSQFMMPRNVGIVPFSLVAMIVVLFALAIGPGDWLLLGRLKAHRFTWILFPALSVLCTLALMLLANHYLGANERHTRLEIVDCGEHGTVLRCDTIESVFTGHAGAVRSEVHQALWSPMNDLPSMYGMRNRGGGDVDASSAPAIYEGALPGAYTVSKMVSQWSPALRRSLSFTDPGSLPIQLPDALKLSEASTCTTQLAGHIPGLFAMCWYNGRSQKLLNTLSVLNASPSNENEYYEQWLEHLCIAPRIGYFTLVSQISPCGGNLYDDMPIYDESDPAHWLLVVAVRQQDTIHVERRLYPTDGKEHLP
jgi:hypothetical protein